MLLGDHHECSCIRPSLQPCRQNINWSWAPKILTRDTAQAIQYRSHDVPRLDFNFHCLQFKPLLPKALALTSVLPLALLLSASSTIHAYYTASTSRQWCQYRSSLAYEALHRSSDRPPKHPTLPDCIYSPLPVRSVSQAGYCYLHGDRGWSPQRARPFPL